MEARRQIQPRTTALIAALMALVMASCVPMSTEPMPDIPQTPEYETVRVEYGTSDQLGGANLSWQASVGAASTVALFTRHTVANTNQVLYRYLSTVSYIRTQRPSRHEHGYYEWETTLQGDYYRFELTEDDAGDVTFELWAGNSASDSAVILDGEMTPLEDTGQQRQEATGRLRIDLDAARQYDETVAHGEVFLAFRSARGIRQVRVGFDEYRESDAHEPLSGIYEYVQLRDATGFFTFFVIEEMGLDGEPQFLSVDAAWTADQAGRAHGIYADLSGQVNLEVDKCWAEDQRVVYQRTSPTIPSVEGGEVEDCAGSLQGLELSAPRPDEVGEVVPQVPEPHPEE